MIKPQESIVHCHLCCQSEMRKNEEQEKDTDTILSGFNALWSDTGYSRSQEKPRKDK
jgi:hypothetical protein